MPLLRSSDNVYVHARVSKQLSTAAKLAAAEANINFSEVFRTALEEYLQARGYLTPDA
jgi:antitoxin component of RelBE/YafQ-DinJ toxin-antitoxin module